MKKAIFYAFLGKMKPDKIAKIFDEIFAPFGKREFFKKIRNFVICNLH